MPAPKVTFITWPKPFVGPTATRQRTAIRSWTQLQPRPDVILFGDEPGVYEAAGKLAVDHVADVLRNEFGTVRLDDLFAIARSRADTSLLCLVNADVVLFNDFGEAVETAVASQKRFLLIGRCREVDDCYADEPLESLRARALLAPLRDPGALDYFVFPEDLYREVPPFALGRAGFDNWLVWRARRDGARVVDATAVVSAVHLRHDYDHVVGGRSWSYGGAEAHRNVELAGGWLHLFNADDSTHRLLPRGMRRNWRGDLRSLEAVRRLGLRVGALRRRRHEHGTMMP